MGYSLADGKSNQWSKGKMLNQLKLMAIKFYWKNLFCFHARLKLIVTYVLMDSCGRFVDTEHYNNQLIIDWRVMKMFLVLYRRADHFEVMVQ